MTRDQTRRGELSYEKPALGTYLKIVRALFQPHCASCCCSLRCFQGVARVNHVFDIFRDNVHVRRVPLLEVSCFIIVTPGDTASSFPRNALRNAGD